MRERVTSKELEAAMAASVDEDGNDLRLAEWLASLTDDERQISEENLRRSLSEARASSSKRSAR